MTTTEFRLGNNITANNRVISIGKLEEGFISWKLSDTVWNPMIHISNENLRPIPLTGNILKELGFGYHPAWIGGQDEWAGMGTWYLNWFGLVGNKSGRVWFQRNIEWEIKYVHQLQNLYHTLTGEEI